MTAQISLFGIFCIIIFLIIFRSTIRTITRRLPTTANRVVSHLDKCVTVNLIEEDLDLNKRLVEIENELPEKIVNADDLWERLHEKPAPNAHPTPASTTRRNRKTQTEENK